MKKQKYNREIYSNFLLCIKRVDIVFNVVLIFFIHPIALPLFLLLHNQSRMTDKKFLFAF